MLETGRGAEPALVFVYGALRSGTTLVRLMLDAHPQVSNPGETDFLFDYLFRDENHPTGWRYDFAAMTADRIFQNHALSIPDDYDGLDLLQHFLARLANRKPGVLTLNIHRNADRIVDIFPDTRIIHVLRDPRDVARSSIGMGWAGTLYHGVGHWMKTETAWDAVAGRLHPERVFDLRYESLFSDVEGTLRDLSSFLGVPYDPNMLNYHKKSTYAPPDISLVEQWRRKSPQRDITQMESRARSLMTARGYTPSTPQTRLSIFEKGWLSLKNKAYRWRFGIRRFGLVLYVTEKLTRWLRLSIPHRRVVRRMNAMVRDILK